MNLRTDSVRMPARIVATLVIGLLLALAALLGAPAATAGETDTAAADGYPPPVEREEVVEEDVVLEEAEVRGVTLEREPPAVGALPVTGGQLAWLLALGAALLAVGGLAVRAARRRPAADRIGRT